MSSDASPDRPDAEAARAERERRRRAAELLGDLLPSTTSDERDPGDARGSRRAKGGTSAPSRRDDELMRDVPPHHGG